MNVFFFVQDKSQITMITMWLIELYLNELGELKDGGEEKKENFERVRDDLRKLLATSKVKVMNVHTCNLHSPS